MGLTRRVGTGGGGGREIGQKTTIFVNSVRVDRIAFQDGCGVSLRPSHQHRPRGRQHKREELRAALRGRAQQRATGTHGSRLEAEVAGATNNLAKEGEPRLEHRLQAGLDEFLGVREERWEEHWIAHNKNVYRKRKRIRDARCRGGPCWPWSQQGSRRFQ